MPARDRPRRDDAHIVVLEAMLLALVVIGGVGYVTLFRDAPDSAASTATDVRYAGEDALTVLNGLDGCAGLDAAREAACEAAHGRNALTRFVTDALAGNATNLSLRANTLLTRAIAWNAYLDTGDAAREVTVNGAPSGERVTTALAIAPEWNLTWLTPAQTPLAAAAPGAYDDAAWWALPVWKSRALADDASVNAVEMTFPNGDTVAFDGPVIDAPRPTRWTLAHWAFDEGAGTVTEESRSDTTSSIDAARWVTDGAQGTALLFRAEGSALGVTHPDPAPPAVTLATWARPHAAPSADAPLVTWTAGTDEVTLALAADGSLTARVTTPGHETRVTSPSALTLDAWTHAAAAVDAHEARLFVNGERVARASLAAPFTDATPPAITVGHAAASTSAPVDADLDRVTVHARALEEDDWSALRVARVPRATLGTPGWDATTGSALVTESAFTHNGAAFTGRATYEVASNVELGGLASAFQDGVNASVIAAAHNATGARVVPKGDEVALEADWRPLLEKLEAAGVTTANPVTTITVRAPVTQPFESRGSGLEVEDAIVGSTHGFTNLTVPGDWLLGSHALVAHLDVDVTTTLGDERVRFTRVDYFHVTPPRSLTVPVSPVYRVVLELWVPEWGP